MAKVKIELINGNTGEVVHEAETLNLYGKIEVNDKVLMNDIARTYLLYQHDFVGDKNLWPWTAVILDWITYEGRSYEGWVEYGYNRGSSEDVASWADETSIYIYAKI